MILYTLTNTGVRFVDVQQQQGSCDCGLFALAFATSIVLDVDPIPSGYRFQQQNMRRHLRKYLLDGEMKMFPGRNVKPKGIKSEDTIKVFVSAESQSFFFNVSMIQCNKCEEWYHVPFCVNVLDIIHDGLRTRKMVLQKLYLIIFLHVVIFMTFL